MASRLLCFAKSKPNGKLIYNYIMHCPYVRRIIPKPGDPDREVPVAKTFHEQTDEELTKKEVKQMKAYDQAIQTILMGLPEDIYAAVDSCETAQKFVQESQNQVVPECIQTVVFRMLNQNGGLLTAQSDNERDAAYLQTQLLTAQKEEARIQLQAKEFDLMATAGDLDEIEEVNANCILMAICTCSDIGRAVTELLDAISEPHRVQQNDSNVISAVYNVEQSGGTIEQNTTKKKLKSNFKIHEDDLLDKQRSHKEGQAGRERKKLQQHSRTSYWSIEFTSALRFKQLCSASSADFSLSLTSEDPSRFPHSKECIQDSEAGDIELRGNMNCSKSQQTRRSSKLVLGLKVLECLTSGVRALRQQREAVLGYKEGNQWWKDSLVWSRIGIMPPRRASVARRDPSPRTANNPARNASTTTDVPMSVVAINQLIET
ncbi:hypothetical protein Tco_1476813 [Tanacetum coccineum]